MNAVLVLNPQAGSLANATTDPASPMKLHDAFAGAGVDVTLQSASDTDLDGALAAAIALQPDAILVGGGDGTISAAAARLVATEIALGVLPLGTLNHFARDLGTPTDWRAAVAALARGRVARVDVGEVNGRVFVNNCSIGSYAEAVRRRERLRLQHGHGKWRAMLLATLGVFRELRRLRLRLDVPGADFDLRTPFLLAANNRYSGHVLESSLRSRLDEGRLWFYSTRAKGRGDLLRLLWQALFHQLDAADGLDLHSATEAVVTSAHASLPIAVDGELATFDLPLRFRVRARALRVLAPAPARDA